MLYRKDYCQQELVVKADKTILARAISYLILVLSSPWRKVEFYISKPVIKKAFFQGVAYLSVFGTLSQMLRVVIWKNWKIFLIPFIRARPILFPWACR